MPLTLSLNTNPLVNRFADPDDLIDTVARDLKIRDLQLTHEFINPSWPAPVIRRLTRQMMTALRRTGVRVTSGMTGPYGRLNHFGHPDRDARRYYVDWFKTFADIIAELGGVSVGTQFAIFTFRDYDDPVRREDLIRTAVDCWAEVAEHAGAAGLRYVFWEPMSIGREFGETIAECLRLQDRLTKADMAAWGWARMVPFILGEGAFGDLPNVKRHLDALNARPAAQAAEALKGRHAFKAEMDAEARSFMFRAVQGAA